jgi:amidase
MKFTIAFYPDTSTEHPSQSSLENALQCNISAAENAKTLAFLRKLAGPDGIDQILNLFKLDAVASLADSPLSSVASAAGRFLQV